MGALRDYLPLIVMVPGLAGIHYGWYLLQQNEKLVPKHQQVNEQPIITASRELYTRISSWAKGVASGDSQKEK